MANHEDRSWRGIIIKRGEHLTSINKLSLATGLSNQKVRTALEKLQSTKEITNKSTKQYRIIKLNNYNKYQENNKENNKGVTNEQQSSNKGVTTNKNYKNEEELKELKKEKEKLLSELEKLKEKKLSPPGEKQVYGNPEINSILEVLKLSVGVDQFKETQKLQRIYGKHFHNLLEKIGKEDFRSRLENILADNFKAKNCNSLKYLYGEMKSYIHSPIIQTNTGIVDLDNL